MRSEGAGGQALLVHEVWHAFLVPGESCCGRVGDCVAGNNDGVTVDHGLSFDEFSVFARDLKPVEGLGVARGEPASGMVETQANLAAFDSHRFVEGTGVDEVVLAVVLRECPECETFSNVLLVVGMQPVDVADVRDDGHARVGNFQSGGLRLPEFGESLFLAAAVAIGGDLHEVEGGVGAEESVAPGLDERLHLVEVEHAVAVVLFALIPGDTADDERDNWVNHRVVKKGGVVDLVVRIRKLGVELNFWLVAPGTGQADAISFFGTGDTEGHGVGVARHAAGAKRVDDTHGDGVGAGFDKVGGDTVNARLVIEMDGGGTHALAVEPRDIAFEDTVKVQHKVLARPRCGNVNGFAKPNHTPEVRQARFSPLVGELHGLPAAVIKVRTRHFESEFVVGSGLVERLTASRGAFLAGFESEFVIGFRLEVRQVDLRGAFFLGVHVFRNHHRIAVNILGFGDALGHAVQSRDFFVARPGFDDRSAPRGADESDRHVDGLVDFASEVVPDRREVADGLGRTGLPLADDVVLRIAGQDRGARNVKEPDVGMVGCFDFGFAVGRLGNAHFHVGLAGAEPDLAHEDVGQANCLFASFSGHRQRTFATFEGRQGEPPAPLRVRAGASGVRTHLNGDNAAGRGPAPNRQGLVALEDHVVGEDACRSEFGL